MSKSRAKTADTPPGSPATANQHGNAQLLADLNATVRKSNAGDKDALATVQKVFASPGVVDALGGNIARTALWLLVNAATGGDAVMREATARKFNEMRAELLGPNPTALERLLVERIVATWFHLHQVEARYAGQESMLLSQGLYYQKCISAAQKRYFSAIKGLAEVRKLVLPAIQVNIAKKQINVAAGASG